MTEIIARVASDQYHFHYLSYYNVLLKEMEVGGTRYNKIRMYE